MFGKVTQNVLGKWETVLGKWSDLLGKWSKLLGKRSDLLGKWSKFDGEMKQIWWGDEATWWGNEAKCVGEMPHRQSEITPISASSVHHQRIISTSSVHHQHGWYALCLWGISPTHFASFPHQVASSPHQICFISPTNCFVSPTVCFISPTSFSFPQCYVVSLCQNLKKTQIFSVFVLHLLGSILCHLFSGDCCEIFCLCATF